MCAACCTCRPTPGAFVTDGFMDIVKFSKQAAAAGLLVVLRPGPFICDGPDYGGFPWWLTQHGTHDTANPEHTQRETLVHCWKYIC